MLSIQNSEYSFRSCVYFIFYFAIIISLGLVWLKYMTNTNPDIKLKSGRVASPQLTGANSLATHLVPTAGSCCKLDFIRSLATPHRNAHHISYG